MGCAITKFNPAQYGVGSREWNLTNPDGQGMETVREAWGEIESRVDSLSDETERLADEEPQGIGSSRGVVTALRDGFFLWDVFTVIRSLYAMHCPVTMTAMPALRFPEIELIEQRLESSLYVVTDFAESVGVLPVRII
jgi:hypothetical protein